MHRWYDRLRQYNYTLQFTPGRDNVVADILSRSVPAQAPHNDVNHIESEIIHMLHTLLQSTVTLQELKAASEQDPVISQLCTYIRQGWPRELPEELLAFSRVKQELSC